jgi:hypothetical protein
MSVKRTLLFSAAFCCAPFMIASAAAAAGDGIASELNAQQLAQFRAQYADSSQSAPIAEPDAAEETAPVGERDIEYDETGEGAEIAPDADAEDEVSPEETVDEPIDPLGEGDVDYDESADEPIEAPEDDATADEGAAEDAVDEMGDEPDPDEPTEG